MKLGTLLLRNAAIGLSQLEGALRNQVLYGGRLGTNLVELGFLDLEQLSGYLAELSGFAVASPSLLDNADPRLLERLGSADAHRLRAIPLGYLGEGTNIAAVALVEPRDAAAVEQVTARLGVKITPYIVPELRALYYLEKHYGLPRRPRFVRPGQSDTDPDLDVAERRRSQPAGTMMPPAFTLEPRQKRAAMWPEAGTRPPIAIAFESACHRIDTAPHRERIADVFAEYGRGRCEALVVFLVRDGNAIGWRGYVARPASPKMPVEELSLPLGGASSLQSAHDACQPFVGPPAGPAHPTETRLWAALGTADPSYLIVVPLVVKERVVNLIYAHAIADPWPELAAELTELASRAQATYLRLIRQARGP
jgi:hypothetical protein